MFTTALLAPSGASAAEVSYYPDDGEDEASASVWDNRRERNRLSASYDYKAGFLRVVERGRPPLVAGEGCRQRGPREVTCRTEPDVSVDIDTGTGADDLVTRGLFFVLDTGPGDDTLRTRGIGAAYVTGGSGKDRVVGGPGPDRLMGGRGRDTVLGGGGDDLVIGDGDDNLLYETGDEPYEDEWGNYRTGHAADVLDGGRGTDLIAFVDHLPGVRVDMAAGTGPEGDRLRAFEHVAGGMGDDVLRGDRHPNTLAGGSGRDRLVGRGGPDVLDGSEGDYSPRPPQDRFDCGGGLDLVREHEFSVLPFDCEQRGYGDWRYGRERRLRAQLRDAGRGRVAVEAACPEKRKRCDMRVTLSAERGRLGRRQVVRAPGIQRVVVRLRRRLPANAPVTITVETKPRGAPNWYYPDAWRIRCKGPPACAPSGRRAF